MPKKSPTPYGYCPRCGAPGIARERRIDGNDQCSNGHTYPSRDAAQSPAITPADLVGATATIGGEVRPVLPNTEGRWESISDLHLNPDGTGLLSMRIGERDWRTVRIVGSNGEDLGTVQRMGAPIGVAAILAPLADLTHPILPEPIITDPEREAMISALTALRDPESDPVEVPLPASCPDLASVQAFAAVLRVTANRMGLAVQFYPRAPRVGVSLALMARRSLP